MIQPLTPEEIAEARRLYAEGLKPSRIAYQLRGWATRKTLGPAVRAVLDLQPVYGKTPPDVRERARVLKAEGLTFKAIGRELDLHPRTVRIICGGPERDSAAEAKKRYREAIRYQRRLEQARLRREASKPIPFPEPVVIEVPRWVPDRLFEFYEHRARVAGEEAAAVECRKLKHGASLAHL
jgi:hypothetical protein